MSMNINIRLKELTLHIDYDEFARLRGFHNAEEYKAFINGVDGYEGLSLESAMYKDFKVCMAK